MLLVLDNFEHLLPEGVSLPLEILSQTANIRLLITSRERLSLQGEWVYDLRGLSFPKEIEPGLLDDAAALEEYDAIQLFVQRARQSNVNYTLTAEDLPHVIRISQLVEGMPLGLELAAPWVRFTSPREIAREIERNLDFLATDMRNVPERHRSLRAILEQTWQQLPEPEQEVLRDLSLFKGSWSREAAEQVAGASLPDLASLANRALIRRGQSGRYEMHTLVRLFALKQLQFAPGEYEAVQKRHAGFYTRFLQERTPHLKGNRQKEALAEITADLDNVRAAWQWAVEQTDAGVFDRAAEGLWLYYEYRGALQEGDNAFEQAIGALRKQGETPPDQSSIMGYLMAGRGWLCARRGTVEEGRASMEAGIRLIRQSSPIDRHKEAMAVHWLGYTIMLQGKFDEASRVMQESLELSTATGDRWGMAGSLRLLGTVAQFAGRFKQAEEYLERALEIGREIGQGRIESKAVMNLGVIATWSGDYPRAQALLEEAVEISRDLNDLISLTDELRELGRLHLALGEYNRAVEIMQETLAICDVIGRVDRGGVLSYLATALSALGNDQEAERLYQESLAASGITGHKPEIAAAKSGLGLLALGRGQYGAAEEHLKQALAIWEQIEHEPETASVLRHLGHLSLARQRSRRSQAWEYYRRALELAHKHSLAPIALDVMAGVAQLLVMEGDTQRAASLLALAAGHPASAYQTKAEAERLAEGLPPPAGTISADDWQRTAAVLLEEQGIGDKG
jgi:predicted ATPase/Flp pilus assembly protein TadD